MKLNDRIVAWGREESDACERGTVGCSIDHAAEEKREPRSESGCEAW
jgi:hypothetical protein